MNTYFSLDLSLDGIRFHFAEFVMSLVTSICSSVYGCVDECTPAYFSVRLLRKMGVAVAASYKGLDVFCSDIK